MMPSDAAIPPRRTGPVKPVLKLFRETEEDEQKTHVLPQRAASTDDTIQQRLPLSVEDTLSLVNEFQELLQTELICRENKELTLERQKAALEKQLAEAHGEIDRLRGILRQFEVTGGVDDCKQVPDTQVASPTQQGLAAFRRDCKQLFDERPGQWVAYHGNTRVGFAATQTELYQYCLNVRGLKRGEFLVRCIEPEYEEFVFGPRVGRIS